MRGEHVQNLRYKLQKRVRRLNSLGYQSFHVGLRQFFNFVDGQPLLCGIIDEMVSGHDKLDEQADKVVGEKASIVS